MTMLSPRHLVPSLLMAGWLCSPGHGWGAETNWVTGITEPIKDITMAFAVIGVVGARLFEEGAVVKQGQVIMELDKRLEELDVERRKLVRDLAQLELERVKSLAQRNAISLSREELDKRQAEFDIARVDCDLAAETVRRRMLVSPFDGAVAQFYKDVGEKCEEQQPVLRLVDTRRAYFVANLEAKTGQSLRLEQTVKLEVPSDQGPLAIEGRICYVSPVVDPASGLLRIKAVFDNAEGRVRPGVAGRMQLP